MEEQPQAELEWNVECQVFAAQLHAAGLLVAGDHLIFVADGHVPELTLR